MMAMIFDDNNFNNWLVDDDLIEFIAVRFVLSLDENDNLDDIDLDDYGSLDGCFESWFLG